MQNENHRPIGLGRLIGLHPFGWFECEKRRRARRDLPAETVAAAQSRWCGDVVTLCHPVRVARRIGTWWGYIAGWLTRG
jgi:hypothetical protein